MNKSFENPNQVGKNGVYLTNVSKDLASAPSFVKWKKFLTLVRIIWYWS